MVRLSSCTVPASITSSEVLASQPTSKQISGSSAQAVNEVVCRDEFGVAGIWRRFKISRAQCGLIFSYGKAVRSSRRIFQMRWIVQAAHVDASTVQERLPQAGEPVCVRLATRRQIERVIIACDNAMSVLTGQRSRRTLSPA